MTKKKVFAFCNQKGGVGKTTSVSNVAAVLAELGHKVLIIDMDAQANCTSGLGLEKPSIEFTTYQLLVENIDPLSIIKDTGISNLSIIPSSADLSGADLELINSDRREYALKNQISKIIDSFDFIFIDCPPSLGLITINALVSSDCVIIPLQCEYYALEGLGQLLYTVQLVQTNLNSMLEVGGVLLTMADFRTNLTQQVIEEVKKYFTDKVFETIVPRSVKLSEAPSFGKPAVVYDPYNRGSKCYKEIGKEFARKFAVSNAAVAINETNNQNLDNNVSHEIHNEKVVDQLGQ
jgi:chromosome partitioning protein